MPGFARSTIRGPRFAFRQKENLQCCEACVFGVGPHTCPRAETPVQREMETVREAGERVRLQLIEDAR